MKKTLAKTLRSALALVLSLVMVLGTVGTTFAAEPKVDVNSAMDKLVAVLEQYGPDVVEEARQYVEKHGYVEAVKDSAAELKAALAECAAEHEFLAETVKELLAGPVAELEALKDQAQNLVVLIALYKSGAVSVSADAAAVITIPGYGTIDTDKIDEDLIKDFDIDDLSDEQKKAIEDSGLIGNVKLDELTDEQVEALKDAGLKGEIDPTLFTEEQLKDLQNAQNQLNATIEAIEKTQNTVNALEAKIAALKAKIAALKEAAQNVEDLTGTIIAILKQETVQGAELAAEKYVAARNALFALLEGMENPVAELADLTLDIAELSVTVITEIKDLSVFLAKDVVSTVKNNKLLFAGAFVLTAEKLGVSMDSLVLAAEKIQETLPVVVDKVVSLVDALKAKAYKAYKDATTADLHITYGTNYVAIGDDAILEDGSYVDLLNDALLMPYAADKSMADYGILIQDTELDAEAIANAELITIGYSVANFAGDMVSSVLGGGVNWSAYLPEAGVKAINTVMDEIELYIEAMGFSATTANALTTSVENVAFNALAYAYAMPKTIAAIREINEDAVLVVVGLDNPMENVTVTAGGKTLGLDALTSAVVALTDIYSLAYAILANNCTFVAAPNARNDFEGSEITKDNVVSSLLNPGLLPNAKGQEYIKNEILDALNVSYGFLLGDANLDGKVNYLDALIVCQYSIDLPVTGDFIYLPVSNVTNDAKYNYLDGLYICQKSIDLIDKFPIEG